MRRLNQRPIQAILIIGLLIIMFALIGGVQPAFAGRTDPEPPDGCTQISPGVCKRVTDNCVFTYEHIGDDIWIQTGSVCTDLPPDSAGLWLADVCEPLNGLSSDGNLTMDTDADDKGLATTLYVGATADGPWTAVAANGPAWVFNEATLNGLATSQGVASYTDLWFSLDSGLAINLGDAIIGRDGHMDELCGTTSASYTSPLVATGGTALVLALTLSTISVLGLWFVSRRV